MQAPAVMVVALLSLAGCVRPQPLADEKPTFREFRPDAAPVPREAGDAAFDSERDRPDSSPPSRGAVLRSAPPPAIVTPPVQHLPDAAFSEPFTPGPITGYGAGGMQHEPGMPHNPPWN